MHGTTSLKKEELYIDIHRRLRDVVSRRRHDKWGTNIWFLLHNIDPAHRSAFGQGFLSKEKCDITETYPILS